jgi:hypothetical protein
MAVVGRKVLELGCARFGGFFFLPKLLRLAILLFLLVNVLGG